MTRTLSMASAGVRSSLLPLDRPPRLGRRSRAQMPPQLAAFARSTLVHVAFAFLAMGAWAVFANRAAGLAHALTAGLVQGLASGAITLALKRFLEAASMRLSGVWALVTAHRLAGTAHVWATISLPWAVSSTYAWVYVWTLTRERAPARA